MKSFTRRSTEGFTDHKFCCVFSGQSEYSARGEFPEGGSEVLGLEPGAAGGGRRELLRAQLRALAGLWHQRRAPARAHPAHRLPQLGGEI